MSDRVFNAIWAVIIGLAVLGLVCQIIATVMILLST